MTNGLVGNVASYDGATLKVTKLFNKAILLPIFTYGDCMALCSILCTWSAMGVAEIPESTNLNGVSTYFCIHSVSVLLCMSQLLCGSLCSLPSSFYSVPLACVLVGSTHGFA